MNNLNKEFTAAKAECLRLAELQYKFYKNWQAVIKQEDAAHEVCKNAAEALKEEKNKVV